MNIELANRLSALRKEQGFSQETLATALNVSRQAVSKWERGETSPDTDNLIALALLYKVSLDALVGFSLPDEAETETVEEIVTEEIPEPAEAVDEPEPEVMAEAAVTDEPPAEQGFTIEDDEHIVHICNGVLTVKHKPKPKRSVFAKLFGVKSKR